MLIAIDRTEWTKDRRMLLASAIVGKRAIPVLSKVIPDHGVITVSGRTSKNTDSYVGLPKRWRLRISALSLFVTVAFIAPCGYTIWRTHGTASSSASARTSPSNETKSNPSCCTT